MCTEFTNINKACLKECYPLSNIDRLLDSSARAGDRSLPFFKAIKRGKSLSRPQTVSSHSYLQSHHLLSWLVAADVLQLYLAVSGSSLSIVLIREEAKVQMPAYYVSRVMRGAE
ncbi:hypothetical protein LIER_13655 [Lithospermum erythrorhizon]|uniref:Uncharacterized protein n=1 Tax=Lithospermum erythrorhizon TaxID=34254 RepID=A0AAV3Q0E0_LITER